MTKWQVEWAKQHDWFRHAQETVDGWTVTTRDPGPVGDTEGDVAFTSFKALREWAGY